MLDDNKKSNPNNIGLIWYAITAIYTLLIISTGYVTFIINNDFAEKKIIYIDNKNQPLTQTQLTFVNELLDMEIKNINNVNALGSQSFNVVLGALLGFLSATATMLTNNKNQDEKENNKLTETVSQTTPVKPEG